MANILLAWEFGGGLGHLLTLEPIARALKARGHRITVACRDPSRVPEVFSDSEIAFVQAPKTSILPPRFPPRGFADILAGIGFSNEETLDSMFLAWNAIFDQVGAHLVVLDYAPLALLASWGRDIRRANVGVAFFCPQDVFPLPSWSLGAPMPALAQLMDDERALCRIVNHVLDRHGRPQVRQLSHLFNRVDALFLATYPELDPLGRPDQAIYWGHWNVSKGMRIEWPSGRGARIFTYLKPFPGLEELLRQLADSGCPTIAVSDAVGPELQTRFNTPTIVFEKRPLDMNAISKECDLAIFHAGHGTIASMLLAGKPCFLFPKYIEQAFNAQAIVRLGAGRVLQTTGILQIGPTLGDMLTTEKYRQGAQRFATRYGGFEPGQQIPKIVEILEQLLSKPADIAQGSN